MFGAPKDEAPAVANNPEQKDLREETARWIAENPKVAQLFLRFARELAARGRLFGVGLLAERVRWEYAFEFGQEFKVNNNYRAYIARWLIAQDPKLEQFLKFRKTRW